MRDWLDENQIRSALDASHGFVFDIMDETDSTSSYLKRKAAADELNGFPYVAVARTQTGGRGRLNGRSFLSREGGLYFSCAFRAEDIACPHELITMGAGVAVAKAVERLTGESAALKWVNDVLVCGKKVCGILCESINGRVFIVGIGINVNGSAPRDFMPHKVGNISVKCSLERLLAEVLDELTAVYADSRGEFVSEYNKRLSIAGKRIEIKSGGEQMYATVKCADARGLECVTDGGESVWVRTCDEIVTDLYGE